MDFKRQLKIFDPEENHQFPVSMVGCGSVGSFTALALAKMGVNLCEVFDGDRVEEHNLPNQFFRKMHVGLNKVSAVGALLQEFSDANPILHGKLDKDTRLNGVVVISAVDSMDARRLCWHAVKKSKPMLYIDSRMGGRIFSVHSVDMLDNAAMKEYGEGLAKAGAGLEVPCTERSIIFNVLGLASVICNQVVEFVNQRKLTPVIHFDYSDYTLVKPKRKEVK